MREKYQHKKYKNIFRNEEIQISRLRAINFPDHTYDNNVKNKDQYPKISHKNKS